MAREQVTDDGNYCRGDTEAARTLATARPGARSGLRSLACVADPFPRTPLPPGMPGAVVARLSVSPEVGEALERALKETERIDLDGWR